MVRLLPALSFSFPAQVTDASSHAATLQAQQAKSRHTQLWRLFACSGRIPIESQGSLCGLSVSQLVNKVTSEQVLR
jgi:hypothetical protein